MKEKRNAIRFGKTEIEAAVFAVDRYGAIQPETMKAITDWLKTKGDLYKWEEGLEMPPNHEPYPIIKTQMKGSFIYKIIDNEHDAQNSLANIKANP